MRTCSLFFIIVTAIPGCQNDKDLSSINNKNQTHISAFSGTLPDAQEGHIKREYIPTSQITEKGPLLLTDFESFDDLKSILTIEYVNAGKNGFMSFFQKPKVVLTHRSRSGLVKSELSSGVREIEFINAARGSIWERIKLSVRCPFGVINRHDIRRIVLLGRRKYHYFGEGDVAFYDLAEQTVRNITPGDRALMTPRELGEKGYLNTFNHITAQALMTSVFSEQLADFIADTHERYYTPELITGQFTDEQIDDIENGAVDNYIDIINNEWGQEIGKHLKKKYNLCRHTIWTPGLLCDVLNDLQAYYSWVFEIGFRPFCPSDKVIQRYCRKLNIVMGQSGDIPLFY